MTVFSQTSSQDSIKCFTYEQARKIAAKIQKGEICDSIAQNQQLQILNFREIDEKHRQEIELHKGRVSDHLKTIKKQSIQLKISKRLTFVGVPVAFVLGYLVAK